MSSARPDWELTRCTCGAWAWLHEPCDECDADEVLTPYINGLTSHRPLARRSA